MLNPQEPLWLPKGSVRAIIALLVVVFGGGFLIAVSATEAIIGIIGVVIGWYFAKRDAEAP